VVVQGVSFGKRWVVLAAEWGCDDDGSARE